MEHKVIEVATIKLFKKNRPKGTIVKAVLKLVSWIGSGKILGGHEKIDWLFFKAVDSIHMKGKIMANANTRTTNIRKNLTILLAFWLFCTIITTLLVVCAEQFL
jgi:hypothetical protein